MLSGSPETAKPLPNRTVPGTKLSSAIVSVERSVAIDPVENVGVALSFDDFKPDNDIVDEDGMPGKPSPPVGSVLGSYSHVMIPPFGSQLKRTEAPCRGSSRSSSELDFFRSDRPRYCTANNEGDAALRDVAAPRGCSS
jgi:hypothetical protein